MRLDRKLVLQVAELAHLELEEAEIRLFARQLQDILNYIEKLKEVAQPAEPFSYAHSSPFTMRPDIPGSSLPAAEAVRNAPESVRQFFKVPRIIP
jgi:aspartyl-tRNA(Asn)/glutamyl-tRNA(Gln) amidotransferase subunit C